MTTKRELRIEALKLAVATQGNSNKVTLANEYLAFLQGGEDDAVDRVAPPVAPQKGQRK